MKFNTMMSLFFAVCLTGIASLALAQDATVATGADEAEEAGTTDALAAAEEDLEWGDYLVKAYTLTVWGGGFSGATYLENDILAENTVLTDGAADIIAYDGGILSKSRDTLHYEAAHKEIRPGDAYGGRIGIYIADDFHIDLLGSYAAGEAVTTMLYTEDPEFEPDKRERVTVDVDSDFKVYRGGVALTYNATPANIFGIVPRLGFGLGGIINRYSVLEDKTALYLEGNFGLTYEVLNNFELVAQLDLTTFAFEIDDLGYSQMVNYATYSLGLSWFIDRVPEPVRASHLAAGN